MVVHGYHPIAEISAELTLPTPIDGIKELFAYQVSAAHRPANKRFTTKVWSSSKLSFAHFREDGDETDAVDEAERQRACITALTRLLLPYCISD